MDVREDQPLDDGVARKDHGDLEVSLYQYDSLLVSNLNVPWNMSLTVFNNYLNNYLKKGKP